MKKVKLLVAAMFMAVTLGLPAKAVFAAAISLTQADFTFADCDDHTANAKGIICYDLSGTNAYKIPAGDYILGENINLGTGSAFTSGVTFSLDLNGKSITNSSDMAPALELDATTNTISGTGTIASTSYAAGVSANGVWDEMSGELTTRTTTIINGNPSIKTLSANGVTLTINGGTYTSNGMGGAINLGDDIIATINNAEATATAGDAMYIYGGKLTINGGKFTSQGSLGICAEGKLDALTITGGTFTGKSAGLSLTGIPTSASLSGGTYSATGSDDWDLGPIVVMDDEVGTTTLSSFLAPGAAYSDSSFELNEDSFIPTVYLTKKSVTITNGSSSDDEGEETPAAEESTSSSSSIGAPDSGRSTKETASATTSALATLLASSAILGGIYAGKKVLAKKA